MYTRRNDIPDKEQVLQAILRISSKVRGKVSDWEHLLAQGRLLVVGAVDFVPFAFWVRGRVTHILLSSLVMPSLGRAFERLL